MRSSIKLSYRFYALLVVATLLMAGPLSDPIDSQPKPPEIEKAESFHSLDDILHYISTGWDRLSRSMNQCETFFDSKTEGEPFLYLPVEVPIPDEINGLPKRCKIRVVRLPEKITPEDEQVVAKIRDHGLLFLEHPYVVPGGQFNEMYGWDSYFIVRGLLRDNRRPLARGMVENFFYEIQHYGGVLNANRTYYLGRSQPPFLTSMILALYNSDVASGQQNLEWLARAYQFAVTDYEQWTRAPHLAGDTGLSRYFDEGDGPVPEIMGDPSDYYRRAAHYYLENEGEHSAHLVRVDEQHPIESIRGPAFEVTICDPGKSPSSTTDCDPADRVGLTADYYKGDRSLRESGFDITFRFGAYGAETHHYAPICLNSLLYKTELDLAEISGILKHPEDAKSWREKAAKRKELIDRYLWDPAHGLYTDYNFETGQRSRYEYATTFYPLWVGLASKEQAGAVEKNLALFEQAGGLAMSVKQTGAQWDFPYGWAPIQLLALEGLRRYGYGEDADRISGKFLTMVLENFRRDRTIREKYNVVTRSTVTRITAGYVVNVSGFGWTNAVFLELLHESPPQVLEELRKDVEPAQQTATGAAQP
jgi:alpha,alpha-trehalase